MNNKNKNFWDKYYKTTTDDILKPSSFAIFVYENYIEKYNNDNVYLKICDLGSGNCRDTIFFSNKKNLCYGVDINGVLNIESDNCKLIKKDVESVLKNDELCRLSDIIYMRWFIHALPYNISNNIFINAVHNLKPNGLICIEVRSINDNELKKNSTYDENDKSYTTTHKRWLYSIDMCKELASNNDCDILYCEEGYFSPNKNTETENPLLIRFVCRK
jgi:tellurite methyltransferase